MAPARREWLELGPEGGEPGGRERSERCAVVGELARDDLRPRALAPHVVVVAGQLPGGFDGLGAAGGEEDAVQVARGQRGDAGRKLDRGWVSVAPVDVETELARLLGSRLAQFGAPVAGIHAEQRRKAVEVALAVLVVDVAPFAAHDDRHLVVGVGAHPREVHPQMPLGLCLERTFARAGRCFLDPYVGSHSPVLPNVNAVHAEEYNDIAAKAELQCSSGE